MKESNINKYSENLREGIFEKIAKLIASKAAKKAIDKAMKLAPDDKTMQAEMDSLKAQYERFEKSLESFCKRNPNHRDCKNGGPKTLRWK